MTMVMATRRVGPTQAWFSANGQTFNSADGDGDGLDYISMDEITDPVVIEGASPMRVYERSSIEKWLRTKAVDPYTRQDFSRGYRLVSVRDVNPRSRFHNGGGDGGTNIIKKLSGAQEAKLHSIFLELLGDYGRNEVRAEEITDIFKTPDGQRHRLVGLDHVYHFKYDVARYAALGYGGNAEAVFKKVAAVICDSESPPHDWQATRSVTRPGRGSSEYYIYSAQDISEVFTWTHGGIKYEVSSDSGDDYWYFRGTIIIADNTIFFQDVEIRGNAFIYVIHDRNSPYLRDMTQEDIKEIVRKENENLKEALENNWEDVGRINDIQARKYALMRLFCDKYVGAPGYSACYRLVDCIKNARDEIILIRGIGVGWKSGVTLDIKAKHWYELDDEDRFALSAVGSRSGLVDPFNLVFLVCEDDDHPDENIVASEVDSFWKKVEQRFPDDPDDDDYGVNEHEAYYWHP